MNAEALIGTVLGTCTLQKLIGQGGMGAVYLAQQSRPRRQVAVKVLLPMTPLTPNQLAAFLERFRRETDAAAALEHPNIMPVHEYGEREGLAYLVMPYISGGTLRDLLEREGSLPLDKAHNFLEQMAAAIDVAHEHGVIHRDIKPANILMTPEGRALLTDFGLVKIIAEGQTPQLRLTGPGAPVGTPDYMAPEQVIGEDVDTRADLYSLGVILYQMVTGTTPFQGESPMQIAAQHLQLPPPSPQALRPDLPYEAEQVILRAMAKRPEDRYARAQDLANAFRMALLNAGILIEISTASMPRVAVNGSTGRMFAQKGVVEPAWSTAAQKAINRENMNNDYMPDSDVMRGTGVFPTVTSNLPVAKAGGGLLSRTGMMPALTNGALPVADNATGGLLSRTGKFPQRASGQYPTVSVPQDETYTPSGGMQPVVSQPTPEMTMRTNTGALATADSQNTSGSVKLTGPVKVVKVPVAGQPGRFVTGLLPVAPQDEAAEGEQKKRLRPWVKVVAVLVLLLIILGSAGAFFVLRPHSQPTTGSGMNQVVTGGTPNTQATSAAQATATVQANVLVNEPLDQPVSGLNTTPASVFSFKDGAYHIADPDNLGRASILQNHTFTSPLVYTLTAQEIKGNDGANNNTFGLILCFNQQNAGNKTVTTFYSFEVENTNGGSYRFWKYDDSKATGNKAWTNLWHAKFGKEFHQGHDAKAANTFKITMNNGNFTFTINGKQVGKQKDTTFNSGMVGMIVNLKGTEVAFKNMLITRN